MATATLSPPRGRVDRQAGVVRNVKIIGNASKKGRYYPQSVLRESMGKYEGVSVYANHVDPGQRRRIEDKVGVLRNVHEDVYGGLRADFHMNKEHPLFNQICEGIELDPASYGFSHDARGPSRMENGRSVVTRIDDVLSCDLVARPASTTSIWESEDGELIEGLDGDSVDLCGRRIVSEPARVAWAKRMRGHRAALQEDTAPPATVEPAVPARVPAPSFQLLTPAERAAEMQGFRLRHVRRR